MPQIRFAKPRPPLDVPAGANLMKALLAAGLPVASSCRGDGVCAKCRVQVIDGATNLNAPNDTEKFLRERHGLTKTERISCQTEVLGDVVIDTSYW